ncbi:hypothetical protein [Streptomyces sp. NPDC093544]|uniref:hypothetical protein n=1 Tax=Streptomyces sp. NPDC093544 TaxID=3155200 RepID=UPI00342636DB
MLAFVAAALFLIAFLIHATETSTEAIFSSTSLMLVGLAFLAAHSAGVGSGWSARGSSTRRSSTRGSSTRRTGSRR